MRFCGFDDIRKLRREKQKAVSKNDLKEVARLCNVVGEALSQNGDYEEAISEHQMEFDLSQTMGDALGAAIANRKIGECYCELGQFEKALEHQQRHLQYGKKELNAVEEQRAYATLGRTYLCQSDAVTGRTARRLALMKAQESFFQSLEVCKRLTNKVDHKECQMMRARLILNLGLVCENRGDITTCKKYLQKGIVITQNESLHEDLHRCQFSLAAACMRGGDFRDAFGHMEEALKTVKKLKDPAVERETLSMKALICLHMEDFSAAKRCLKKAHKLCQGTNADVDRQKTLQSLKSVLKMETFKTRLNSAPESDRYERKALYEKLGDRASSLECYKLAITYYKQMLTVAKELASDDPYDKSLVPVYVSLSQTYMDDKEYKQAEVFFRKELACYQDEHSEMCRTLINIAEAQDQSDQGYDAVKASYMTAWKHARQNKDKKLQAWVLQSLSVVQETAGDTEGKTATDKMLKEIVTKYKINLDEEDEGKEGPEAERDSQPLDDSDESDFDLDMITDSEDSAAEEEFDRKPSAVPDVQAGRVRRVNTKRFKLNEKGETPLHTACIEGKLKRVKMLIEQQSHPVNPRDYAGWLPLHEACNHGHADIVEYLLDHGAHIDDRGGQDCDGITPLIDACGCGNGAVIEVLIRKGANVLAKDEAGNTPLKCLLAYRKKMCGTLTRDEVEELNETEIILRKATRAAQPGHGGDLSTSLRGVSPPPSPPASPREDQNNYDVDELPDMSLTTRRAKRRWRRSAVSRSAVEDADMDGQSDSDADHNIVPACAEAGELDSENATDFYREAMSRVGSAASRVQTQPDPTDPADVTPVSRRPALISEDEDIGEDWLIDDMGANSKKNRTNSADPTGLTSTFGARGNKRKRDKEEGEKEERRRKRGSSLGEHSEVTSVEDLTHPGATDNSWNPSEDEVNLLEDPSNYDLDEEEEEEDIITLSSKTTGLPNLRNKLKRSRQVRMTAFGVKSSQEKVEKGVALPTMPSSVVPSQTSTVSNTQSSLSGSAVTASQVAPLLMKLKVRIKDKLLLVPVRNSSETKTIGWLAKEASERYYKMYHMRPTISLTDDGAALSPDDLVVEMFSNNDEVQGIVDSWDLVPLPDRYEDQCQALKLAANASVKTSLQVCHATGVLSIHNLALGPQKFQAIAQALKCQSSLTELHLPGNCIGDVGLDQLTRALETTPDLTVLDLSNNGITQRGLQTLVGLVERSLGGAADKALQNLSVLKLGYNMLGDSCTLPLSTLLRNLPHLEDLALQSTEITQKFFQHHRTTLSQTLQESPLEHLDVSYNKLGGLGTELLLKCLCPSRVHSLNLTGVAKCQQIHEDIIKHVLNYALQEGCVLQTLNLNRCQISSGHMLQICRLIQESRSLQQLSLSNNPDLDSEDVYQLLEASAQNTSKLDALLVVGSEVISPLGDAFIEAYRDKVKHPQPLTLLELSSNQLNEEDISAMTAVWTEKWGSDGVFSVKRGILRLSLKDAKS